MASAHNLGVGLLLEGADGSEDRVEAAMRKEAIDKA